MLESGSNRGKERGGEREGLKSLKIYNQLGLDVFMSLKV
jgi:hypothetical protein